MPIYQCSYQRGLLNEATKAKVASAITDAHSAVLPRETRSILRPVPAEHQENEAE